MDVRILFDRIFCTLDNSIFSFVPHQSPACCQPLAVGLGLAFKFSMFSWGPNLLESNQGFLADKSPPNFRYVSNHNRSFLGILCIFKLRKFKCFW